jgi:hypothetical protein
MPAITETTLQAAEAEFLRELRAYVSALLTVETAKNGDPQAKDELKRLPLPVAVLQSEYDGNYDNALRVSLGRLVATFFPNGQPSDKEKDALVQRLLPTGPNDPARFGRDDQPPGNR